ncbi:hypothetical protein G7054_g1323 [Neopestalotiopsis clavispora]|nr:hypothetical protein G7054_g1323 [Neopestalotiopsis clavispora]
MSADNVNMGPSAPGASRQRKSASTRGKYAPQACQECRRRRANVTGLNHHVQSKASLKEKSEEQANSQVPESELDVKKAELQGALYSEQPGSGLGPVSEDQVRFFGTASGRLDLQQSEAALYDTMPEQPHADNGFDQAHGNRVHNPRQERFNAYSHSLAAEALRDLPPELVEHLIDVYFEWEQPWFQMVDEELFRSSRQQSGRYYSPVLLCCIIAIASRYSDRHEVRSDPQDPNTAGLAFIEHAEALIHFDLKWPSITTVQSLAIMAIFYVAVGCDAAGWLHHGMASRLIIDMGLNIDTTSVAGSACLNARDIKLRRQIYWTLYCSDKLYASYTGRVCTMLDSQASVPLPGAPIIGQDLGQSLGLGDSWTPPRRYWENLKKTVDSIQQGGKTAGKKKSRSTKARISEKQDHEPQPSSVLESMVSGASTSESPISDAGLVNGHAENPYPNAPWSLDGMDMSMDYGKLDLSVLSSLPWDYALESSGMDFWS